jgi:signal transduction histidine kinase/phage shock protein PspC (stress-responsive transcriptional regulator)
MLGGVCGGVARALGLDPLVVRVAVVALTLAGGTGAVAYVAAWLFLPLEGEQESLAHAAARNPRRDAGEALAVASIILGIVLLLRQTNLWFNDAIVWPVVLAGFGLAVIWRQAEDDDRPSLTQVVGRLPRAGPAHGQAPTALDLRSRRAALARVVVGVALVVVGVSAFLAASNAFSAIRQAVLATAGIVAGLALISGPWWLRLGRDLARERRERIRSEERAEVAAHLHDSVLQTLALIQRTAEDPRAVVAMARRQERELRGWLYENQVPAAPQTLAAALSAAAEEVESLHGATVEVVTVGDCALDERLSALVAAAREAMVNAAKWSSVTSISVYGEVRDGQVSAYVRDWGKGFDPGAVGPDHHGIRESITGRMQRHGGSASIRTAPGDGTEIQLRMSREGG